MDFGRIENIEEVDFTLPPDHKSLAKVLGGSACASPKIYVGGVLWASDSFVGSLYPPKTRPADFVKHYTRQFNTIELNATHYRVPPAATLQRWALLAPEAFRFCPKVHQSISHAGNLLSALELHQQHTNLFQLLGNKLGTGFLQLPPQFSPQRLEELLTFLDKNTLPGMAIELRHAAWFREEATLNALCNFLYRRGLGLVLSDTPGRRDVLHMRLTNKTAFVRFNAHSNYEGDKVRIDAWVEKAKPWLEQGLEQFYFFVHAPHQLFMPGLVIYFIERLRQVCGILLPPPVLYSAPPAVGNLF